MHGSVVWALTTAVGLWALLSVVSALASGVAQVGKTAASATGAVVSGAARAGGTLGAGDVMSTLGIDTSDLVAPINERLRAAGKPPITADQLDDTLQAIVKRSLHEGRMDREVVVEELARNTSLSRADAEEIANRLGERYERFAHRAEQAGERVTESAKAAAQQAADKTGKALLMGGLMMLLSLGAAAAGGALGVRGSTRRERREPDDRTPAGSPPPSTTTESTIITSADR